LPRQALRDVDREPGLAGGGRAGDDEEGRGSRGPRLWRSAQPLWLAGGHLAARANSRIKRISNHSAIRTGRAGPVGRAPPTIAPRSAYGPAFSIRTWTRRPTSPTSPVRWTSLCSRLRPDNRGL